MPVSFFFCRALQSSCPQNAGSWKTRYPTPKHWRCKWKHRPCACAMPGPVWWTNLMTSSRWPFLSRCLFLKFLFFPGCQHSFVFPLILFDFPPSAVLSKKQVLNPWISLLERLFPIQTSSLLKIHCYGCRKNSFFAFVSLFIHNSVYRFFETETTQGECKEAQYVSKQKPLLVDATGRFHNEYLFYWAPSRSTELAFETSCLRQRRFCIAY